MAVAFLDEAMPQFVAAPCTGGSTHSLDELPVALNPLKRGGARPPKSRRGESTNRKPVDALTFLTVVFN